MAVAVDPGKVRAFEDAASFHAWLVANHATASEVWVKIHRLASGRRSITPEQAIDIALRWGWIGGARRSLDARSFLQRYAPRGGGAASGIDVDNAGRLIYDTGMAEPGPTSVEQARAPRRWSRPYARVEDTTIPADLQAAIDAEPAAGDMLARLSAKNRLALAYVTRTTKTDAERRIKIETLVEMLKCGETIYPQRRR